MRRFINFLTEAKETKPKVETTGHLAHAGDFLYYGDPDVAIHHHEKMFDRLHNNAEDPEHPGGGNSQLLRQGHFQRKRTSRCWCLCFQPTDIASTEAANCCLSLDHLRTEWTLNLL